MNKLFQPTLLSTILLSLTFGCGDKKAEGGGNGSDDTGNVIQQGSEVVWDDNRHATSVNFMGAYTNGTDLYVVTTLGQAWVYSGGTWTNVPTEVDKVDLTGIWGSGSGANLKMYAVGHDGTILKWSTVGWEYTDVGSAAFSAIDGESASNLIAVGGAGAWTNKSGTWEAQTSAQHKFNDVWYNGTSAVAVGDNGGLGWYGRDEGGLEDLDGEGGWIFDEVPDTNAHLYGVHGTSFNNVWAVGQAGTVLHWNGVSWQQFELGTSANMWSVWSPANDVAYIVGQNGRAYQIDGTEVKALNTGIDNVLYAVTGTTEANIWATGARGVAIQYPSSGE
jgi:hypothetical protein